MGKTSDPAFWALGSLALAIAGSSAAWLALRWLWSRQARTAKWPVAPAVTWLAWALFALWPPVLAWRSGALSPFYLGLTETDWLDALGTAGLLAVAIIGMALLGWLVYRRRVREDTLLLQYPASPDAAAAASGAPASVPVGMPAHPPATRPHRLAPEFSAPRWLAPFSAALDQWHWAFYRAAAIGWIAAGATEVPSELAGRFPSLAALLSGILTAWEAQPLYWGCWLGLLLAGLEWIASPFTWSALRTPGRLEGAVRAASLCVATTALFALTRNFWLCLLCGLAVETLVAGWFPMPEAAEAQGSN